MGLAGVRIDVTGRSAPPRIPDDCYKLGERCVPLFYDGFDEIMYAETTKGRFTELDLPDGDQLVIEEFVQPASEFKVGLKLLRPLLAGLELSGS